MDPKSPKEAQTSENQDEFEVFFGDVSGRTRSRSFQDKRDRPSMVPISEPVLDSNILLEPIEETKMSDASAGNEK